jgi:AAA domain
MSGILYDPPDHGTPDAAPLLAGLRNGAWLDAQNFPPLAYAVPGVVPEGSVLLVGPPKIGKSWFVLTVALAAATGGRALSIAVPRRPTLYLALEDGDRRLQDRCRKLLGGDPIPREFEYLIRVEGPVLDTIAAWLDRQHDVPPLVILDTLGKVMPPAEHGETSYGRDYRVGTTLKRVADEHPGMTLLTNHHDRKAAADDFVDSVSGTHGLAGAADTVIVLTRSRHETSGLLKITGRDVPEGEYALQLVDGCAWDLDGAGLDEASSRARQARLTGGLGDRSAEIIAFVAANPPGVRAHEVEEKFGPDARRYLKRLADAGRLQKLSRGYYTSVPSVPSSHSQVSEGEQRDNARDSVTNGSEED